MMSRLKKFPSVVVASVNGWDLLGPTLRSLDAQPERPRMEVIVVEAVGNETRRRLLEHRGAKSGLKRTSPLMYHDDGTLVAVAASKAGQPTNPAWFHNLEANPDTTIQIGAEMRHVRARVATEQERARLWPEFVAFYPGYEFFREHAGSRRIPIVILERSTAAPTG